MSISVCGVGPCLYVFPKVIQKISVHAYIHTYLGTHVSVFIYLSYFFFSYFATNVISFSRFY